MNAYTCTCTCIWIHCKYTQLLYHILHCALLAWSGVQGGRLTKAPSMTLSESQALDSFDFLGAEDVALLHRMSRVSFSGESEGASSPTPFGFSKDSLQRKEGARGEVGEEEEDFGRPEVEGGTTGVRSVDVVLIQHLLHCEYLLQHLQVLYMTCLVYYMHEHLMSGGTRVYIQQRQCITIYTCF